MSIDKPILYPTMPVEKLVSWAIENNIAYALDYPAKMLLVPTSRVHTNWLWVHNQNNTSIKDIITRRTANNVEDAAPVNAPLDFQQAAIEYLLEAAINSRQALEDEATLLMQPMPHDIILRTIWDNLLNLRSQLRLTVNPRSKQDRHTQQLWLDPAKYRLQYKEETIALCSGGWIDVHIYLDGRTNPVVCSCRSRCRISLSAIDQTLEMLSDDTHNALHNQITRLIGTPKWRKDLELLDKILISEHTNNADAKLGWRIKEGGTVGLEPVYCKHSTTGWRQKKAELSSINNQPEHPSDDILLTLSMQRNRTLTPIILKLLTTHPRVFLGGRSKQTTMVVEERFTLHFRNTPIGIEWDLMCENHTILPTGILDQFTKNNRHFWYTTTESTFTFVKLNDKLKGFIKSLSLISKIIPRDAVSALYKRIPAIEHLLRVELDPELLGTNHPPDSRPIIRITTATPQHLRLEMVVQPFGESIHRIGEGKLLIYHYDPANQTFGYCNRDPESEQHICDSLKRFLNLPTRNQHQWVVTDSNQIFQILSDLKNLPEELINRIEWQTQRPRIHNLSPSDLIVNIFNSEDGFELEGKIDLDSETLPLWDILSATRACNQYLLVKGHVWYTIEDHFRKKLTQIADTITPRNRIMAIEKSHSVIVNKLIDNQIQGNHSAIDQEIRQIQPVTFQPSNFPYLLRPYQIEGVEWMLSLQQWTSGGCLADEMGLGKTIQTLAFIHQIQGLIRKVVIIAPKSTLSHWYRETLKCLPNWSTSLYYGPNRKTLLDGSNKHCIIMTYDIMTKDIDILKENKWDIVILDEAQALKNPQSARTQSAHLLNTDFTIALTGTPIENSLLDLWSIISIVIPNHLGTIKLFKRRFAVPIQAGDLSRLSDLQDLLQPFLLRRQKEQVAPDLPPKIEINEIISLSTFERDTYDHIRNQAKQILEQNPNQAKFHILALLTKLRQVCCHRGLVVPATSGHSSKLERALELIINFQKNNRKVLVFSQFVQLLQKFKTHIEECGFDYCYLDGSSSTQQREKEIDRFQNTDSNIFLISLKAGGNGINLTSATEVIHLDPWWNPAVEDQASDRAHRIGQTQTVTVIRLLAENTIETQILRLQQEKRLIADNILADNISSLSLLELEELLE